MATYVRSLISRYYVLYLLANYFKISYSLMIILSNKKGGTLDLFNWLGSFIKNASMQE